MTDDDNDGVDADAIDDCDELLTPSMSSSLTSASVTTAISFSCDGLRWRPLRVVNGDVGNAGALLSPLPVPSSFDPLRGGIDPNRF